MNLQYNFPIFRLSHKLKGCFCNKARPEGSIAEGYLANDCLIFCSHCLHRVEIKFNRPKRNYNGGKLFLDTLSIFYTPG